MKALIRIIYNFILIILISIIRVNRDTYFSFNILYFCVFKSGYVLMHTSNVLQQKISFSYNYYLDVALFKTIEVHCFIRFLLREQKTARQFIVPLYFPKWLLFELILFSSGIFSSRFDYRKFFSSNCYSP